LERAESGHGQVMAAVGEAGVGKSRLVYEFIHSHRTQGWLVLESASVSYGKATPYFPVVDLLKRYVHVEDGDEPRTVRAKVTGQVLTLDETLQETIPALLLLLDALPEDSPFVQLDPPQRRQRTLDGLKRILLRESQVQPLLLVFEDLHWIDSETQALLDSLVESLPTAQLLLMVNYRPEYQHGWGSKTYYTQLRLDPLPPESADEFLAALLGNDSSLEPLKKLLIERTEGNPFFLEESVRTLVETRVLVGEPGAYRLTQELPSIQVPTTVQAVLAARIDRLPQDEKRLIQTAAVIGTEVSLPLLQAIAELPEEILHRGLTHLQATEFLYETSLFPEHIYTFKHALTHDVAYGSLLQGQRRILHARIVEALETLGSDQLAEQVERLAHHAFRGEKWDKALMYFQQAGAKAMAHSAYREAVRCFDQALSALQHLPESYNGIEQAIDLRLDLRNALLPLGEHERIIDTLHDAERLAATLDDQRRLGWVCTYLTHYFRHRGNLDNALVSGQRALTLASSLDDNGIYASAHFCLAEVYYSLGDFGQAITALRQKEVLETESVASRRWLTQALAEVGRFAEGSAWGEEAVQLAEALDHPYSVVSAYRGLGYLYVLKGDVQQALPFLHRALELCRVWNLTQMFATSVAVLGHALGLSGRPSEALALLQQAVEQIDVMGLMAAQSSLVARLRGEPSSLAGRQQEATDHARRALELANTYKERGNQAHALRLLGDIAMRRDPPEIDQAETHYQQALGLAEELGMRPLQAHCHRGLGMLYGQTGQAEQARAELSTAIELYRDMEMTFWLPETEAALAQVEGKA
jgi:tetratricopeptide (TPR) repeat protein